jgi:hypothetical protein
VASLGQCPKCGADSMFREKRPDGNDECRNGHTYPSKDAVMLGWCPTCGEPGKSRERRPNGNDTCTGGHTYPSAKAVLTKPAQSYVSLAEATAFLTSKPMVKGPLAIAVADHQKAEELAFLLGFRDDPFDQGVRVIPYAASALAYCGPGTVLFRGLVVIPPRPGSSISPMNFDHWIEMSIRPYVAPGAPRIVL